MPTDVVVESALGPERGYYHHPDTGTVFGAETLDREEAEAKGYSRCRSCFPDQEVPADA